MGGTQDKMAEDEKEVSRGDAQEEEATAVASGSASRVQFAYQPGGPYPSQCGYCRSPDEQFKLEGLWSNEMTVHDFQDLVDRGCQRSGKFVYLPANKLTCCPQYVMRLDVKTFRISKQQRRVIRRLNGYLREGLPEEDNGASLLPPSGGEGIDGEEERMSQSGEASCAFPPKKKKEEVKPGIGPDSSLPKCRKAKEIRRERREKKLAMKMAPDPSISMDEDKEEEEEEGGLCTTNLTKELQLPDNTKHKLTVKLICVNPLDEEFENSYKQSYEVFRKFQMIIHKEPPEKCEEEHFKQFCIESPLILEGGPPGLKIKYGSYHQQYWIDDILVMVGVLDIIPRGILCNYLYYDPKFRYMAPGVYSALYEISMNQELYRQNPQFRYYYMGYYVHDCPKMNYKRQYHSSYLLCLESLKYFPLAVCRAKLDVAKYTGFSDDEGTQGSTGEVTKEILDEILVVPPRCDDPVKYSELRLTFGSRLDDMMTKYVEMVGTELSHKMILHLTGLVQ